MNRSLRRLILLLIAAACVVPATSARGEAVSQPTRDANTEVQLVAEDLTVRPGETAVLGVRFKAAPHWHLYWQNPGEPGLPPTLGAWQLPEGMEAPDGFLWPAPKQFLFQDLTNYVYEGEWIPPFRIEVPAGTPTGPMTLGATLEWLACDDETCVPGRAELEITLEVAPAPPEPDPRFSALFAEAWQRIPQEALPGQVRAVRAGEGGAELRVSGLVRPGESLKSAYFFSRAEGVVAPSAEQPVTRQAHVIRLELTPDEYREGPIESLGGVVVARFEDRPARSLTFTVPVGASGAPSSARAASGTGGGAAGGAASGAAGPAAAAAAATSGGSGIAAPDLTLLGAVVLALLGGMLLNLMPCVFPILSIKILGFVRQAGEAPARVRRHGYAFGAGVIVSFWILAGLLILLTATLGRQGWGFQLQDPWFVSALTLLMVAVGLNLFGVFEIGYGLMNSAARASERVEHGGYTGSFMTGVLATVIATPCTAPFMGPAIGWALTVTPVQAMLVFTALGAGMALPYVVLSIFPGWLRWLPSPGPWMATFKQAMAFPILATALWLAWVFGNLTTGTDGMMRLLGGVLLFALALWVYGRWSAPGRSRVVQGLATGAALALLALALFPVRGAVAGSEAVAEAERREVAEQVASLDLAALPEPVSEDGSAIRWIPFDPDLVARLREAGHPVFIDFTADWCLTCQANKRAAIDRAATREVIAEKNVVMVKADWTRENETITKTLAQYGRRSVPLYVVSGPGLAGEPEILPNTLTPGIVIDALERAAGSEPAGRTAARR